MGAAEWSDGDGRGLLAAHYEFYRSLDTGERPPATPAQRHFVAVCRGTAAPETDHERAYMRFKQAAATAGAPEAAVFAPASAPPPCEPDRGADTGQVINVPVRPCAGCGRPIPPERLAALPAATRCVACQRSTERAEANWRVTDVECPRCAARGFRSHLVWRTARAPAAAGYFLGCSRFPECRYVDRS